MTGSILKRCDGIIGPLLTRALPKPAGGQSGGVPRSILVIRPGGIGDGILLVPALRALKAAFPGVTVEVLAEQRNAAAFRFTSAVASVRLYHCLADMASVFSRRYDLVIDTEQWYRLSAVAARLVPAPVRIGFGTNDRARLFTHAVPYDGALYEADSFLRLLQPLGIAPPAFTGAPFLELPPAAVEEAAALLAPLRGRPFVSLFPGASVPEKRWGTEKFRALVAHLRARDLAVVLVGGDDTRQVGAALAGQDGVLDLTGSCSLAVTAAAVTQGRVLVTGDSGLLHLAAGFGTPTVSLFGPSDPRKWGPVGENHIVLSTGLSCAPCSRYGTIPPCSAAGCISQITVAQVAAAADAVMERVERCCPGQRSAPDTDGLVSIAAHPQAPKKGQADDKARLRND